MLDQVGQRVQVRVLYQRSPRVGIVVKLARKLGTGLQRLHHTEHQAGLQVLLRHRLPHIRRNAHHQQLHHTLRNHCARVHHRQVLCTGRFQHQPCPRVGQHLRHRALQQRHNLVHQERPPVRVKPGPGLLHQRTQARRSDPRQRLGPLQNKRTQEVEHLGQEVHQRRRVLDIQVHQRAQRVQRSRLEPLVVRLVRVRHVVKHREQDPSKQQAPQVLRKLLPIRLQHVKQHLQRLGPHRQVRVRHQRRKPHQQRPPELHVHLLGVHPSQHHRRPGRHLSSSSSRRTRPRRRLQRRTAHTSSLPSTARRHLGHAALGKLARPKVDKVNRLERNLGEARLPPIVHQAVDRVGEKRGHLDKVARDNGLHQVKGSLDGRLRVLSRSQREDSKDPAPARLDVPRARQHNLPQTRHHHVAHVAVPARAHDLFKRPEQLTLKVVVGKLLLLQRLHVELPDRVHGNGSHRKLGEQPDLGQKLGQNRPQPAPHKPDPAHVKVRNIHRLLQEKQAHPVRRSQLRLGNRTQLPHKLQNRRVVQVHRVRKHTIDGHRVDRPRNRLRVQPLNHSTVHRRQSSPCPTFSRVERLLRPLGRVQQALGQV